jgi:hypothetical protein
MIGWKDNPGTSVKPVDFGMIQHGSGSRDGTELPQAWAVPPEPSKQATLETQRVLICTQPGAGFGVPLRTGPQGSEDLLGGTGPASGRPMASGGLHPHPSTLIKLLLCQEIRA